MAWETAGVHAGILSFLCLSFCRAKTHGLETADIHVGILSFFVLEFLPRENSWSGNSRRPWRPCHFLGLSFCCVKTHGLETAGVHGGPVIF
jgi:hypothetical protein